VKEAQDECLKIVDQLASAQSQPPVFSQFASALSEKLSHMRKSPVPNTEIAVQTEELAFSETRSDLELNDPTFIAKWLATSNSSQRKQVQEEVLKQSGNSLIEHLMPAVELDQLEAQTMKAKADVAEQKIERLQQEVTSCEEALKSKEQELKDKHKDWLGIQNQVQTELVHRQKKEDGLARELDAQRERHLQEVEAMQQQISNLHSLTKKLKLQSEIEKN